MTSTRQVQVMRAVFFATVGLLALGLVLIPARQWRLTLEFVFQTAGNGLFILASSAIGILILSRRPGNIIGWIYALVALALAASEVPGGYASRSLPGSPWAALLPNLLFLATVPLAATLLMLLFPTGQLPSPRWRLVVWATLGATAVVVIATALTPGPLEYLPGHQNPLGLAGAGPALAAVAQLGFVVIVVGVFAAAGSLIVRWRRAGGVERQQMKWLAYAAAMMVVAQLLSSFLPRPLFLVVSYTAFLLFPVAIGIAVLRYRLYDIDRLINRTLVYGLLTALLGGVYVGVVLVLGQVFGGVGRDPPSWAVAGATLAVAALFQPARRRIQTVVDRRFNRRKYDAAKTVEAFSARLRDEVDLDALAGELLAVADQTMQPTVAWFWLRPSTEPIERPGSRAARSQASRAAYVIAQRWSRRLW